MEKTSKGSDKFILWSVFVSISGKASFEVIGRRYKMDLNTSEAVISSKKFLMTLNIAGRFMSESEWGSMKKALPQIKVTQISGPDHGCFKKVKPESHCEYQWSVNEMTGIEESPEEAYLSAFNAIK